MIDGLTGREVCEYISRWLWEKHGIERTPESIWNYSPTGELAKVFYLYWQAKCEIENMTMEIIHTDDDPRGSRGQIIFSPA